MELHLGTIIFTIVNFLILLFVLYKLLYNPLTKAMDARKKSIQDSLDAADLAQKEADETKAGLHELIAKAHVESDNLLVAAKKSGELLRGDILAKAEEEANNIVEKAKKEITFQKDAAVVEIKKEIAELAVEIAAKMLREQMDQETQKKLVDKYLKEVGHIQ